MEVRLREVLRFFDGEDSTARPHSNAANAMFGEELGLRLLEHCLGGRADFQSVELVKDPCGPGTSKGKRLDAWLRAKRDGDEVLFQVEVKNWCAFSINGRTLPVAASPSEATEHLKRNWERYWDGKEGRPKEKQLKKVLEPMQRPTGASRASRVEPIACVWDALHPAGVPESWFRVGVEHHPDFDVLWWFSMSSYLRELVARGVEVLELALPKTQDRFARFGSMFRSRQAAD